MADIDQLLLAFELHRPEGIVEYFNKGGSPNQPIHRVPALIALVEMYTRTPRFKDCVRLFIEQGVEFEHPAMLAVLADDAAELERCLRDDPNSIHKSYSLFNCTYTPLTGGTLLHHCAEFNSIACAQLLVNHGADVNARTSTDPHGFGGHTPIYHTVNQNSNNSKDMLNFLLDHDADLHHTVKGLIWGKGYEWETLIPAVNPVSYAMMGLLPQMHRKESTVAETVSLLMKKAYGIDFVLPNVPNAYLKK